MVRNDFRNCPGGLSWRARLRFYLPCLLTALALAGPEPAESADPKFYIHDKPFEAPPYVPPPPRQSKVHLTDNKDGTLTNHDGLMWTHKDSYAHLGKCLSWYQADQYVKALTTGGHTDWRLPTIKELYSIYDDTKDNVMSFDHDKDTPLHLDEKFADGAAYWYWSADKEDTELTDCCALSFYFAGGFANLRRLSFCSHGGVRAVRDTR